MRKIHLYVNQIIVKDNRRAINQNKVKEIAESVKEIGLLHPITVRFEDVNEKDTYTLIAGAHRLEAFKLLDKQSIDAKIIMKSDLQTELIEIDENLIRNELHYSERSDLLARKKEIYEELYPETKVGSMNKSNNYGLLENAEISFSKKPSFVEDTASKTGISKRTIETEIQISKNVIPEAKPVLHEQKIPKTEAVKLAREEPEVQKKIIPIFETGQTKKVEEAKKIIDPVYVEYDKKIKAIDKEHDNHLLVSNLINNVKFRKIDEQAVEDYMKIAIDVFQDEFIKNCDRLIGKLNEMKEYHVNITKIRRVK